MNETIFTIHELAQQWKVSAETVRKLVRNEEGVFVLTTENKKKRPYQTYRIPQGVADRIFRKRCQ